MVLNKVEEGCSWSKLQESCVQYTQSTNVYRGSQAYVCANKRVSKALGS